MTSRPDPDYMDGAAEARALREHHRTLLLKRVRELAAEGLNAATISERLGVSTTKIATLAKEAGVKIRKGTAE